MDLVFDFRAMRTRVGPRIDQVFGAQRRIGSQERIFAHPQAARLFERPDWDAGANDARFATANSRSRIDSGKRIIQVLRDEAKQLRLFGAAEGWKPILDLAHGRQWDPFDRSIDVRITRIRRKIEGDPARPRLIRTVRGAGYRLEEA